MLVYVSIKTGIGGAGEAEKVSVEDGLAGAKDEKGKRLNPSLILILLS